MGAGLSNPLQTVYLWFRGRSGPRAPDAIASGTVTFATRRTTATFRTRQTTMAFAKRKSTIEVSNG